MKGRGEQRDQISGGLFNWSSTSLFRGQCTNSSHGKGWLFVSENQPTSSRRSRGQRCTSVGGPQLCELCITRPALGQHSP